MLPIGNTLDYDENMASAISKVLNHDFQNRKNKNKSYSLRSYARDLGVNAALLMRYMKSERKPSVPMLKKLLDAVQFDESIKLLILNSAIEGGDFKIPKDEEYVEVDIEKRLKMNDWIYSSLMELFRSKNRKISVRQAARLLGLPVNEVETRVSALIENGMIKKTEKGFRTKSVRQSSVSLGKLVSRIHEGYLNKAIEALSADDDSNISGTTILISEKRLEEAKKRIKDFRRSLSAFLALKEGEADEKLYRIQMAMFSLEKSD